MRRRLTPGADAAVEPEFLAAVLEALPEPVLTVAPDGLIHANRWARELQQLPREPLAQHDWAARHIFFSPGSERALALEELPLIRALHDEEPVSIELEMAPSGRERERERLDVSAQPIRRGRRVVGALSVLRRRPPVDTTDPVLPPGLLRHAADGIAVICAATGTFVYANDAWTNALGYAPGDLAGLHVSSVNAPSDRVPHDVAGEMLEVLGRGGVWRGEVELRRRDGVTVWWEQTVSRYDDEHGRPAWIVIGRDATARRASVTDLRDGERRFHAAFDALPVAAAIADEGGRVLAVNDALVELAATGRDELLGRSLEAVLPPVDLDAARALTSAARRGEIARSRYAARCAGTQVVDVTTVVVHHVDGRFMEAVVLVEPPHPSSTS
jgi:PAS domain S-box-containing protein